MATTLLTGVNDTLKSLRLIQGDNAALSSLTDSARQTDIDLIVQFYNEVMDEIYSLVELPRPKQMGASTLTLATNDRSYSLPSDLTVLYWPLHDETNGQYIHEYKHGYQHLITSQVNPNTFTGLPLYGVIRPDNGELFLDMIPDSTYNGRVYQLRYWKDTIMDNESDVFPFSDAVYRAVRRVVIEMYKADRKKTVNSKLLNISMGRAAQLLSQTESSPTYSAFTRSYNNAYSPFEG